MLQIQIIIFIFKFLHPDSSLEFKMSEEERVLAHILNEYRIKNHLDTISISPELNRVAQAHVNDLSQFYDNKKGCNLHSWSANGKWSSCCYTNDHKKAKCMWDKPREISAYQGDGFEIAAYSSEGITAKMALEIWKKSEAHHQLIIQKGIWEKRSFKAMGIGIKDNFACIWFGFEPDPNH
ncbi:MAG: CAP domain-containing protein [Bacteroidia bacterium]